jgi:DNA-binding transcriptional ArsR family regulator
MASKPKVNKRLLRFVESGVCKACESGEASEYSGMLQKMAEQVAGVEMAKEQSRLFKALADETRLRILKLLEVREMCVCEVMVALSLTQPTASHHLGILENVRLVKERKEGKWVFYRIANSKLIENIHKINVF